MENKADIDTIVSFCKRRGFVYPSSEIYGGFSAIYDYGPYGTELINNIKQAWWRDMVQLNDNIVGLDSAIFMHPKTWEASGHIKGFADPLTECKKCHSRFRVDHMLDEVGVFADEKMSEDQINKLFDENIKKMSCPNCKGKDFTKAQKFNLLVQSNLGNLNEDWGKNPSYLRGETCQGIYLNYKNVLDSTRVKIPFGIAQIGKAFRNEITARQFIFRTREFEQMEMQYFVKGEDEAREFINWKEKRWQFYLDLGLSEENLKWHDHENLVFYAKQATDIEYNFPFGFKELEGIHARGDYDLTQHSKYANVNLEYEDTATGEKFVPHIIETSAGLGRTMLAVITEAYREEEVNGEKRVILKLLPMLSPIKIAVFPLLKNKDNLVAKAKEIYNQLKVKYTCEFDDNGNIGKRYRRQDEIGTPYCVTVDFDSLEDDTVTVRDRDTMDQKRVKIEKLEEYFSSLLSGC